MIYFFSSSNKKDKVKNPITVVTSSERRAFSMALVNFKKNNYIGSPKLITV